MIGYEMYLELLEEAVREIKGEAAPPKIDPELRLKIETMIPEDYVPDPQQRMNLYKRLSRAEAPSEIDEIEDEVFDLYGRAPIQVDRLIRVMRVRLAMKELRIPKMDYNEPNLIISFDSDTPLDVGRLVEWAQREPSRVKLLPGDRILYRIGPVEPDDRIEGCLNLLGGLREAPSKGSPGTSRSASKN
jgi:transcription-repair coupling factor (superfamily II helicase)